MSALTKIFAAIKKVAPRLVANAIPGSGIVIDILKEATGAGDDQSPLEMASAIEQCPELLEKIKQIAAEKEIALAQEVSKQIESVNQTMRVEASGHAWASMWRPFWGFASAVAFFLCVLGIIGLLGYAIYKNNIDFINAIPALVMAVTALFSIPGAILGVSAWHRGKMQRVEAGEDFATGGGITGIIKAVKGIS